METFTSVNMAPIMPELRCLESVGSVAANFAQRANKLLGDSDSSAFQKARNSRLRTVYQINGHVDADEYEQQVAAERYFAREKDREANEERPSPHCNPENAARMAHTYNQAQGQAHKIHWQHVSEVVHQCSKTRVTSPILQPAIVGRTSRTSFHICHS